MKRRWWMRRKSDPRRYIGQGNAWERRVWWAVRSWYGEKFLGECTECGESEGHKMRCSKLRSTTL